MALMRALLLLSVIGVIILEEQEEGTTKTRPNILFIMSDDHANKAISCYSD